MANTSDSLDLYAKVEDLLGVEENAPRLNRHYFHFLKSISCDSLLDVGCGSGGFLAQAQKKLSIPKLKGIDLSPVMVERTKAKGIDAQCVDLCKLEETYDVITAVFDMVNYLDAKTLKHFLGCIVEHLNSGGYFVFDANTLYGFENVAVGALMLEDESRFVAIDSDFNANRYVMDMNLFEKRGECFVRYQEQITQHYHALKAFTSHPKLTLVRCDELMLYEMDEADKLFIVLKKQS